jgi:site-specific DNA recombinase
MRNGKHSTAAAASQVRCAVYTRKSTEEGLEQEFNSLDAQRESGEAFIKSQQHEGWVMLPERYDDGGFTGGNIDRPALKRLLADAEAGKIDAVVVYKVDRLSRSLLDFTKLMEVFDRQKVSFVSVTQQFNTATSMGRLVLNVLLSFAQFEREIISERTRDKIAATKRKGRWAGGVPPLGYDVEPAAKKLVVNADEAARVRAIFDLYLAHESVAPVLVELDRRGWATKRWQNRSGVPCGGKPFSKAHLYRLLACPAYAGLSRYKAELHQGQHEPIVAEEVWRKTQAVLNRNRRAGGAPVRNRFGAILKGLLRCRPCGRAMTPAHSTKGSKRYRYYTCTRAQSRGRHACPSKAVPAGPIEAFVLERVKAVGRDPELLRETLDELRRGVTDRLDALAAEERLLAQEASRTRRESAELARRLGGKDSGPEALSALAELQARAAAQERRAAELTAERRGLEDAAVDEAAAAQALAEFEPVWESLAPRERHRLLDLLVEKVEYDGAKGSVTITFHPAGLKTLAAGEFAGAQR